jgi:hypothetical protein
VRDRAGGVRGAPSAVTVPLGVDPFVAVPSASGALVAPLDLDDRGAFSVFEARSDGTTRPVARVEPPGDDDLYTARALAHGGRIFVAWASFHGQLVDVWTQAIPGDP